MRTLTRWMTQIVPVLCLLVLSNTRVTAQSGAKTGEWRTYGGDTGNTRYSPLDQINADNFSKLEVAWRFKTDNLGPRPEAQLEGTPLMANGVIYATGGTRRAVVALDAVTGEELWVHSEREGARGTAAPRQLSGRGLAYWTDGTEERILYVTPGYRLIALDAKTGIPTPTFGNKGVVDLKLDDDQDMDLVTGEVGLHAAPTVAKNVVIVGAAHRTGANPKSRKNVKGYVRGFDVKTGKRLWIFHTIPRPGEYGNETWEQNSWEYTGNTGVWGQISVDEELGLVYLPVESPTGDYYGGHRPGNGLFETVKAVAQPTKQATLYVFDRTNGRPIWPIEERPVAKGDVPGEWYSPTQPFPTKPPEYDHTGVSIDDLIDFTPALREEAIKLVSKYKLGPKFTPPVVSKVEGPIATLTMGTSGGGTNWPGGSYDPETHMLYVSSQSVITALGLVPPPAGFSDMSFIQGMATTGPRLSGGSGSNAGADAAPPAAEGTGTGLTVQGLPLVKPPYGRISAIDLNKGEIVWQVAHGDTPDNVRNHAALRGVNIPRTGRPGTVGTLVTKTLVIAGEAGVVTMPNGRRGAMLRAYDKATGKEVGAVYMPAGQSGSPMTYMLNGNQYIVVSISGGGYTGEILAFRLPK